MKVSELFASIQGESRFAGMPCTFVRLSGCNLRCTYCDTTYAYSGGFECSEDEIVHRVEQAGLGLVAITGGEPLLQGDVYRLIRRLLDDGRTVLVETNGSRSITEVDRRAVIVLDVKTPGSGMSGEMNFSNLEQVRDRDEVKFVVTDRRDYDWAKEIIEEFRLAGKCHILVSPAFGIVRPEDLARWMIADRLSARLNVQLHKYVFGAEKKGV